jgi:ketosteroid isomerase-like protein
MRVSAFGLTVAAALYGCGASLDLTSQERSIEADRIENNVKEWATSLNNRQIDSVVSMYDQSDQLIAIWPGGQRALGGEQNQQVVADFYSTIQFLSFNPQNVTIDVLNAGAAVASFRFSMDIVLNDTRRDPYSGQATLVWTRSAETEPWKIAVQQLSRNPY